MADAYLDPTTGGYVLQDGALIPAPAREKDLERVIGAAHVAGGVSLELHVRPGDSGGTTGGEVTPSSAAKVAAEEVR